MTRKLTGAGRKGVPAVAKWKGLFRPTGGRVRTVSIGEIGTLAAAVTMTVALLTGCEYSPQASNQTATPSISASASSSPADGSLNGKTQRNKFFEAVQYTCADGDTWETVADEFGIKAETLRTFNKSKTLTAGTVLDLRGKDVPQLGAGGHSESNADGTTTYTVMAEDTFYGISSRFGVPGYALRGANPSLGGTGAELLVPPGQKLIIPSTS